MSTDRTFATFPQGSLLSQTVLSDSMMGGLRDSISDTAKLVSADAGWSSAVTLAAGAGNAKVTLSPIGATGTDGDGSVIVLNDSCVDVVFPNTSATVYYIGLKKAVHPGSVTNTRLRGAVPFAFDTEVEAIGHTAAPNSVAVNGSGDLRLYLLNHVALTGSASVLAGRSAIVWKVVPATDNAAIAIQSVTVTYSGGQAYIDLSGSGHLLGQTGTPSTTASDYRVCVLGPVISTDAGDMTDLLYVGTVTGNGASSAPTSFSTTGQVLLANALTSIAQVTKGIFQDVLVDGAVVSISSGLTVAITAGEFILEGYYSSVSSGTVTLPNNATSYVVVDKSTGGYTYKTTFSAAVATGVSPLAKVETSGGAITSVKTMRLPARNLPRMVDLHVGTGYLHYPSSYKDSHFSTIGEAFDFIEALLSGTNNQDVNFRILLTSGTTEVSTLTVPTSGIIIEPANSVASTANAVSWSGTGPLFDLNGKSRLNFSGFSVYYTGNTTSDNIVVFKNTVASTSVDVKLSKIHILQGNTVDVSAFLQTAVGEGNFTSLALEEITGYTRGGFVSIVGSTQSDYCSARWCRIEHTAASSGLSAWAVNGDYSTIWNCTFINFANTAILSGTGGEILSCKFLGIVATNTVQIGQNASFTSIRDNMLTFDSGIAAFCAIQYQSSGSGAGHICSSNRINAANVVATEAACWGIQSYQDAVTISGNLLLRARCQIFSSPANNIVFGNLVAMNQLVVAGNKQIVFGNACDSFPIDIDASSTVVVGNLSDGAAADGINVSGSKVVVAANLVLDAGDDGIETSGSKIAVVGNVVTDSHISGIETAGDTTISGNVIHTTDSGDGMVIGPNGAASGNCVVGAGGGSVSFTNSNGVVGGCSLDGDISLSTYSYCIVVGNSVAGKIASDGVANVVGCNSVVSTSVDTITLSSGADNNIVVGNYLLAASTGDEISVASGNTGSVLMGNVAPTITDGGTNTLKDVTDETGKYNKA